MKSNNLVAVLLAASLSVGYAQTTAAHETALNDFYTGAGGASWTGVTGWGGSDPCGNIWTGVVCSGAVRLPTGTRCLKSSSTMVSKISGGG